MYASLNFLPQALLLDVTIAPDPICIHFRKSMIFLSCCIETFNNGTCAEIYGYFFQLRGYKIKSMPLICSSLKYFEHSNFQMLMVSCIVTPIICTFKTKPKQGNMFLSFPFYQSTDIQDIQFRNCLLNANMLDLDSDEKSVRHITAQRIYFVDLGESTDSTFTLDTTVDAVVFLLLHRQHGIELVEKAISLLVQCLILGVVPNTQV